jgi:hypothetical protein
LLERVGVVIRYLLVGVLSDLFNSSSLILDSLEFFLVDNVDDFLVIEDAGYVRVSSSWRRLNLHRRPVNLAASALFCVAG